MAIEELSHQEDGTGSITHNSSPREKLGMPAANSGISAANLMDRLSMLGLG